MNAKTPNPAIDSELPPIESYGAGGIEKLHTVGAVIPVARVEGAGKAVDTVRAAMEVQAQVIMAHKYPRDEEAARNKVLQACQRPIFADGAMYSYKRGQKEVTGKDGKTRKVDNYVTGPSIKLAEEMARNWGQINTGWGLVEQDIERGYSDLMAFSWDLLNGNRKQIGPFRVWHRRKSGKNTYPVTDDRDIYELQANQAQRRLRSAILAVMPSWLVEEAVELVNKTNEAAAIADLPNTIIKLVAAFEKMGVTVAMLQEYADVPVSLMTAVQVVELRSIFAALKDGEAHGSDYFPSYPREGEGAEAMRLVEGLANEGIINKT